MIFNPHTNKFDLEPRRRRDVPDPFWSRGVSKPQEPDTPWGKIAAGGVFGAMGMGAAFQYGTSSIGGGLRGVDNYYNWVNTVENASPGRVLKTFGVSDMLYGFTADAPDHFPRRDFINNATDPYIARLKKKGYFFTPVKPGGKLGQGLVGVYGEKRFVSVTSRTVKGVTTHHAARGLQGKTATYFITKPSISQKTRLAISYSRAYASSQIQRFNSLLGEFRSAVTTGVWRGFLDDKVSLEGTPFKYTAKLRDRLAKGFKAVGLRLPQNILSVRPASATRMVAGLAGKAVIAGVGIHYLNYLDYLRRTEDSRVKTTAGGAAAGALGFGAFFRNRRATMVGAAVGAFVGKSAMFDQGIYAGFAGMYVRARLKYAQLSDRLGWTEAARRQEELAPGITNLKTPLGFAGTAGLAAGLHGYIQRLRGKLVEPKALPGKKLLRVPGKFFKGAAVGLVVYGAMATLAALATDGPIPGIIASDKSEEELKAIYSGKKDVEIRKGRWWEFGRTPWEGTKVDYYRQHWYPRMLSHARDTSLYGSEEEKWDYDSLLHPIKAIFDDEFKYHWDVKNYRNRPYPVSGTYFEDVPFVGPILASTIGERIKPRRYMHTDEWFRPYAASHGGPEVYNVPHAGGHAPATELGGLPPDMPQTRYDPSDVIGKTLYRLNELRGLTGFAHGAIKEALTGSQDYFDEARRLESSTRAYGLERWYWDLGLGGGLGTTEAMRRYVPHRRRQIELYNPIANLMPSWMPGSNYYIDFRTGDPYTKVKEGDVRLPGRGYAVLNPGVSGLHPEEYPLVHRFKILADVAMWSDEFKKAKKGMRAAQKRGELSLLEIQQFQTILSQVAKKKQKRQFKEYEFAKTNTIKTTVTVDKVFAGGGFTTDEFSNTILTLAGVNMSTAASDRLARQISGGTLKSRVEEIKESQQDILSKSLKVGQKISVLIPNDPLNRYKIGANNIVTMPVIAGGLNKQLIEQGVAEFKEDKLSEDFKYNMFQKGVGTAWEILTHKGETPIEILTPLAPMTKFVHARSSIEEYERTQVYGTTSAFWQSPVQHFLKPFMWSVRSMLDDDYIPEEIQNRRALQDYFDKLKYIKYARLEHVAVEEGEYDLAKELKQTKKQTLFGVDPYGSFSNILKAMPGSERDFFTAFSQADSPEDRERILQLLPANERAIYLARWQGRLSRQLVAENKAGITDDLTLLAKLSKFKKYEGRSFTAQSEKQYSKEKEKGQGYADWQREQELEDYFSAAPLPGPDWIGWHPKVDLDDIKLKVIENIGEDMHDYGLWQSRARTLSRKPYINDETMAPLFAEPEIQHSREDMADKLRTLLHAQNIKNLQISSHYVYKPTYENDIDIELLDDRGIQIQEYLDNPNRE